MTCILCPVYRPSADPRLPDRPPACQGCRTRLASDLASIPAAFVALDLEPGAGNHEPVSGSRTPPLPVRLDPLSLIGPGAWASGEDQVGIVPPRTLLEAWVRDWGTSAWSGDRGPATLDVSALVAWLGTRLDTAVDQHPAIDEFATDIRDTLRELIRVTQGGPTGEAVGRCPTVLRDDTRCGTRLRADPYVDMIACPRCGTAWPRQRWIALAAAQMDGEAA